MIIAIDGPAGSGKSTQAKLLAERLGFSYFETGATYRALTARALAKGILLSDENALVRLIPSLNFILEKTLLLDETLNLRSPEVEASVSIVARHPEVRRHLVLIQQKLIENKNVVLEGRDAATVIASHADLKIFLTANETDRVGRRKFQLEQESFMRGNKEIEKSVLERDKIDSERKSAPLRPSKDAIIVDTTRTSVEQTSLAILKLCNKETHRFNLLYFCLRLFGISVIAPSYFHLSVTGREFIPSTGGFILASNHRSYLDPVILGFASQRMLSFMARDSLFRTPGFSRFIQSLNANPIKRGQADLGALKLGVRLLFQGRGLVVFPEGTRSTTGELGSGRPGVAMMAVRSGAPVIPAWIEGTENSMPKGATTVKPAKVSVRFGPSVKLDDLLQKPLSRESYDEALARIMDAIQKTGQKTAVFLLFLLPLF